MKILFLLLISLHLYALKAVYTTGEVENNVLKVYMHNENLFDITYKYHATYKNLLPQQKLPIEKSIQANTKELILSFKILKKYTLKGTYNWAEGNVNTKHNDMYIYRLPYALHTIQKITQGHNGKFSHQGNSKYAIDFGMKVGTKVYAAREGVVVALKEDSNKHGNTLSFAKHANYITIKHDDGSYAKYTHLKKNSVFLGLGHRVNRGDLIALSGNTGFTNGEHLHFLVYKGKNYRQRDSIAVKFITKRGILCNLKKGESYYSVP